MSGNSAGFIGDIPEYYDNGMGPVIFADYAGEMAKRVAGLRPSKVLETAAGTGIVTRRLKDQLPSSTQLTATDLNPPMLEVARAKFKAGEAVELKPADAQQLPFADASFDAVVCQFGIMFYPDKSKAYREVSRVLAPGGRYLFSVWDAHRYNAFGRIANDIVESFFPTDPPPFYRVPFSCSQVDPMKEALLEAGFTDIDISVVSRRTRIPDAAVFARALVFGNPLRDQIAARGGVEPEQVVGAILAGLKRELGPEPMTMPIQAIFLSARKP